jgi:hypothetical protein
MISRLRIPGEGTYGWGSAQSCGNLSRLARVREAAALPWKDLTAATLAELRFNSIAGWLPEDEASASRGAFQCEINRLYLIAEADDEG